MRYDAGWRQYSPPRPYDRMYGEGAYDAGWNVPGPMSQGQGYGQGYGQGQNQGYGPPRDAGGRGDQRGIYGPARYGLGPYHDRLRRRRRSDQDLREDVEEALFFDTWVDADAITVEVADGIVTLSGDLPSYDEVRFATDDAWDVEGVLGVRTELRVPSR